MSMSTEQNSCCFTCHRKTCIQIPIINSIDNIAIECVDLFTFFGIYLDKYINWKSNTDYIASKISKSIGILNRLKYILPTEIK